MSTATADTTTDVYTDAHGGAVAVIYARVSRDRTGAGLAVARQEKECRELAARLGYTVTHVYTDNDMSAYSGKPRPGYLQLLRDIRAGKVTKILSWHTDRMHRSNSELEEFISTIQAAEQSHTEKVEVRAAHAGIVDLNSAGGRANARFLATMAMYESDIKRERIRAKVAEKVSKGEFHGGKRRWGYSADMSTIDEAEAALIRTIARDIIRGRTLHSIAKELNANGTPPPTWKGIPFAMSPWTGSNLGTMLRRPHLAGFMVHRGSITGRGNWAPILDRETWDAVQGVLSSGGRRTSPEGTARRYLLSGIARCGVCDKPVRSRSGGTRHEDAYMCPDNHVHRTAVHVEAVVSESAVGRLSQPGFTAAFLAEEDTNRPALESRIADIEESLEDMAVERALGKISPRAMQKATDAGLAEVARIRGQLQSMAAAATLPTVLDGLAGNPDVAAVWDGLDLDRRRAVVAALMDVRIERAARRGAAFDPETVTIRWKTYADDDGLDTRA